MHRQVVTEPSNRQEERCTASMEPTAFSELAWLLVVQSNAISSRTRLGNTCLEWYWHVCRLERWRFWPGRQWQISSTLPRSLRLSVLWTDNQRRDRQSIRLDEVTAREQHHPGITHTAEKCGGSCEVRDFRRSVVLRPRSLVAEENLWCCFAEQKEHEDVRGSHAPQDGVTALLNRAGVGCSFVAIARSAPRARNPAALSPEFQRRLAASISSPTMAELAWSLRHTVAVHRKASECPGVASSFWRQREGAFRIRRVLSLAGLCSGTQPSWQLRPQADLAHNGWPSP